MTTPNARVLLTVDPIAIEAADELARDGFEPRGEILRRAVTLGLTQMISKSIDHEAAFRKFEKLHAAVKTRVFAP